MAGETDNLLLDVRDLRTHFLTGAGGIPVVDGVSLSVRQGRTLAIVGETGCGKTVTALSILRLVPDPPGKIVGGQVLFSEQAGSPCVDLATAPDSVLRRIRGGRIAMIFQDPAACLNPVFTVGEQIAEAVRLHRGLRGRRAETLAVQMLERLGIADPGARARDYPHRLSGGMRQRVLIAMALACEPCVLIADEPTSALDTTIAAEIMALLGRMQAEKGMGILLITHDLGVAAQMADDVCVMYAGRIVEKAPAKELFARPMHPYTRGLLRSLPRPGHGGGRLAAIPGAIGDPAHQPPGCPFHPRCERTREPAALETRERVVMQDAEQPVTVLRRCIEPTSREPGGRPELREVRTDHSVACWEVAGDSAGAV